MAVKQIWLADGVAAVFECKTTLKASHVMASFERCKAFKRLYSQRLGSPYRELRSSLVYGLLAHSHVWQGGKAAPVVNVENALVGTDHAIDHPRLQPDVLCVSDLSTWTSAYFFVNDAQLRPFKEQPKESTATDDWNLVTTMLAASVSAEHQLESFRPIAAMLSFVTQRLAWEDDSIRPLADYYRLAEMWGNGVGRQQRRWLLSVLSDQVRATIMSGRLTNGVMWDEWGMSGV